MTYSTTDMNQIIDDLTARVAADDGTLTWEYEEWNDLGKHFSYTTTLHGEKISVKKYRGSYSDATEYLLFADWKNPDWDRVYSSKYNRDGERIETLFTTLRLAHSDGELL